MGAVEQVIFEMQSEQAEFSDVNPIVHYHLTDGTELTIIAGLNDLEFSLQVEVDERCEPIVAGTTVTAYHDQGFACIGIDHPETEHTILRVRSCADSTCKIALSDYWL